MLLLKVNVVQTERGMVSSALFPVSVHQCVGYCHEYIQRKHQATCSLLAYARYSNCTSSEWVLRSPGHWYRRTDIFGDLYLNLWFSYLANVSTVLESCSALSIKGRFTTLKMTNIARDSTSWDSHPHFFSELWTGCKSVTFSVLCFWNAEIWWRVPWLHRKHCSGWVVESLENQEVNVVVLKHFLQSQFFLRLQV